MNTIKTTESKPHPAYQNSGVAWIGDVPEQWKVVRLKDICGFEYGDSLPEEERTSTGVPVYGSNGLIGYAHTPNTKPKCLIIGRKGSSGKVIYSGEAGFAIDTTFFVDRRHTTSNTKWLYYLLTALDLESLSGDVGVPGLNRTRAYQQICPLPTLVEQDAIVRYLDDADQRIRAYVSVKERLIALLEEERQAVIHQAVTKGLDPNVKLKPSGVEWLGEVPDHWEVRRVRTLGQAIIGLTYSPQDMTDAGGGKLVLRASNISGGRVVDADNVYVRCPVPDKLILREGDILICSRSGSRNLIGKNARIANTPLGVTFGAFMTILRGPNNDYLHQVFNSKLFEYQSGAFLTSTINQLTLGILNDMKIPFPPAGEQQSILQYLNEATQAVDATINRARRQIELMGEYRTRLIADVVTGKIDVREAKP